MKTNGKPVLTCLLFITSALQILQSQFSSAATSCDQKFSILGVVEDKSQIPMVWIVEEVYGECMWTFVTKVLLSPDSVKASPGTGYRNWDAILKNMGAPNEGLIEEVKREGNLWFLDSTVFTMNVPVADSSLLAEYKSFYWQAENWNEKNGIEAVTLPQIGNKSCNLLYFYPRGFYLNYLIDRIYIIANRYLLVFTKQPLIGPGLDTMHGFLLLKCNQE